MRRISSFCGSSHKVSDIMAARSLEASLSSLTLLRSIRSIVTQRRTVWTSRSYSASAVGGPRQALFDGGVELIEHRAIGKMRLLRRLPATEIGDGDEFDRGKLIAVLGGDAGQTRPVEMLGGELLTGLGIEEAQEGLGLLCVLVLLDILVDHRHGRLGQDADRGSHDLELAARHLLGREQGLVLPGDQ